MNAIITGANSGIGKETAVQLAQKGWHVVLGCRNAERAQVACREIVERSGSREVEVMAVDTSSQTSIRAFSRAYGERHGSLDVLINNAADFDVARKTRRMTDEGFESVWATNYLGPFLLTRLLTPYLEKSTRGGRVLNVSSKCLVLFPFLRLDLRDPSLSSRRFSMTRSYYHSKLAVVISTLSLADTLRTRRITVNTIRVPAVKIDVSRYPGMSDLQKRLYAVKSKKSLEPSEMARVYTWLATDDEAGGWTGRHVDERRRVLPYRRYELREDVRRELYELSISSTGLTG